MAGKESGDLPLVLLRGEGAGRKHQHPARCQQRGGVFQNFRAQRGAMRHQGVAVLPGGGRLLAEHSLTRAGRVHQHAFKLPGHGGCQPGGVLVGDDGVGHAHTFEILAQDLGAGGGVFVRQQHPLPLQSGGKLAGFAPGRGAEVRHPHTGLYVQQRGGRGGAWLLRVKDPGVVPRVASGAKLRRNGERRGAKYRRRSVKIHALRKLLRRTAQPVDRDAARRA